MNPYDIAHQLARTLKDSPEYKEYRELKKVVDADEEKKKIVEDFRKKQYELQTMKAMGQDIGEGEMEKLHYLYNLASMDENIKSLIRAEQRLGQLLTDIYKIIGDALKPEEQI
ncbi:MAG: hypothetical protein HPY66_3350 [Firmicutes bacterium]|nr:hypothetical protein [Bacillota bacterium]MDI6706786.1 YlbF family regulator [Bacillota bacterium]